MQARLNYVIKFVKDMDKAVGFHRDVLGLPLKFTSPEWSEFATGPVTLALHPSSEKNPPGHVELGYAVKSLREIYAQRARNGVTFVSEPKPLHGSLLATFLDSEGTPCSFGEEGAT
jgi:lactoylglutathione lyase